MKKLLILIATNLLALNLSFSVWAEDAPPQVERGHHKMQHADTDQDGKISQEEFKAAQEKRAEAHFKRMDANSDGQIDKQEVQKAREMRHEKMKARMEKRHERRVQQGQ